MAKSVIAVELVFNHIGKIKAEARAKADKIVRKTAFDIEAGAKQNAPVDTAALENSIYTATKNDSNYDTATSTALGKNPDAHILPEVRPTDDLTAVVGPSVDYGLVVEMGSHKKGARPYLGPAAELARPSFLKAMERLIDG